MTEASSAPEQQHVERWQARVLASAYGCFLGRRTRRKL